MALLSIVLPSYNEEQNIMNTGSVLTELMEKNGIDYELVFVSDGSKDNTYSEICKLQKSNPHVKGAEFSRNFGKEAAIFAGLELATGDAVVVMDCDLQHPPEVVVEMYEKWKTGTEVVEGIKNTRGKENIFHKAFANIFYGIMSSLIKMDMKSSSDFKLLDRKVVNALLEMPEKETFFRALSFWVGFKKDSVYYDVRERQFGSSKWSFTSLVRYAISNVLGFTTLPLKIVSWFGFVFVILSIGLAIQTLVRFCMGTAADGFTTVILLLLMIGGLIMICLGIIGNYIARIYEEVKGRPRYIISKVTDNMPEQVKGAWKKHD
ncbi:MAG: glycosyltransferase family 2 protein [Lachnospiraceae bacterium]|nr:glycosyltransferase family 2 protein [Lachnospiraceae bacterium]